MARTADFSWPQVRTSHGQKCGLSRGHGQAGRLADTASIEVAIGRPTAPSTSSRWSGCDTTNRRVPTWSGELLRGSARRDYALPEALHRQRGLLCLTQTGIAGISVKAA